ncbi:small nucleolar ribonucleoprotein complex subunit Utp14 [Planoprotostelium fungivorum]|uniref:Small nucleolar ribonucleoprotein complex subunit Utp14 n=1 Tax=Planoprotostelium fungivorum TaxID=1890364 RepID=A0A2P6NJ56_9EUKA|nr:small nucleolar ribonucleoprotein complex subunit Utp14 [Planoprotostelium fungivorum]
MATGRGAARGGRGNTRGGRGGARGGRGGRPVTKGRPTDDKSPKEKYVKKSKKGKQIVVKEKKTRPKKQLSDDEEEFDDDDEEIDEEEAFGSGDEKLRSLFEGKSGKRGEVDDEEPGDGEMMDLSEMMDLPSEDSEEDERDEIDKELDDVFADFGGRNDDDLDEDSDTERSKELKLTKLASMVTETNKKVAARDRTEAFEEDQFNLTKHGKGRLAIGDLIKDANTQMRQEILHQVATPLIKAGAVQKPMSDFEKKRFVEQQARKLAEDSVTRWEEASQLIERKGAVFPLRAHGELKETIEVKELKAVTPMEKQIQALLLDAGLQETDRSELTLPMLEEKRAEEEAKNLAKMKNMLYYKQMKQAQQNKIKSKDYRRRKLKAANENKLSIEELEMLDPELAAEERRKAEQLRIEERMTLRHSKKSKISRNLIAHDKNASRNAQEQRDKAALLRKKQHTSQDDSVEEEAKGMEEAREELENMTKGGSSDKRAKLFKMKFMERALIRDYQDAEHADRDDFEEAEKEDQQMKSQIVDASVQLPLSEVLLRSNTAPIKTSKEKKKNVDKLEGHFDVESTDTTGIELTNRGTKTKSTEISVEREEKLPTMQVSKSKSVEPNGETKKVNRRQPKVEENKEIVKPLKVVDKSRSRDRKMQKKTEAKTADGEDLEMKFENLNKKKAEPKQKHQTFATETTSEGGEEGMDQENNPWMSQKEKERSVTNSERLREKRKKRTSESAVLLDPDAMIQVKKTKGDEFDLSGSTSNQKELIQEAFRDDMDSYEGDFLEAMNEDAKSKEPAPVDDSFLPGWGGWAGSGIKSYRRPPAKKPEKLFQVAEIGSHIINPLGAVRQQRYRAVVPKNMTSFHNKQMETPLARELNTPKQLERMIEPKLKVLPGRNIEALDESIIETLKQNKEKKLQESLAKQKKPTWKK